MIKLNETSRINALQKLDELISNLEFSAVEELDLHEDLSMRLSSAIGHLYEVKKDLFNEDYECLPMDLQMAVRSLLEGLNDYILKSYPKTTELAIDFNSRYIVPVMHFKSELLHVVKY